jgi:hypothetical protein
VADFVKECMTGREKALVRELCEEGLGFTASRMCRVFPDIRRGCFVILVVVALASVTSEDSCDQSAGTCEPAVRLKTNDSADKRASKHAQRRGTRGTEVKWAPNSVWKSEFTAWYAVCCLLKHNSLICHMQHQLTSCKIATTSV